VRGRQGGGQRPGLLYHMCCRKRFHSVCIHGNLECHGALERSSSLGAPPTGSRQRAARLRAVQCRYGDHGIPQLSVREHRVHRAGRRLAWTPLRPCSALRRSQRRRTGSIAHELHASSWQAIHAPTTRLRQRAFVRVCAQLQMCTTCAARARTAATASPRSSVRRAARAPTSCARRVVLGNCSVGIPCNGARPPALQRVHHHQRPVPEQRSQEPAIASPPL
ncbi:hypothetical protein Z043_118851, partial [Scleropages formosus]